MSKRETALFIICAMLLGGWLRWQYIDRPIWIDEANYWAGVLQELEAPTGWEPLPRLAGRAAGVVLDLQNPIHLRLPFLAASVACVPASLLLRWPLSIRLAMAIMMATFPLFTFWGAMARPYAMAWPLMILAWRWPAFHLGAILCTPTALVGLNVFEVRRYWRWYLFLAALTVALVSVRGDWGRNDFTNLEFWLTARRMQSLVALSAILHLGQLAMAHRVDRWLCRCGKRLVGDSV